MDTTSCTTIVLALLWLYLCCQALGSLVALIAELDNIPAVSTTTTLSTVLLGICLWQCKKAGYLVSPMTWYHWVLLVLLVILQVVAIVLALQERIGLDLKDHIFDEPTYYIYGISVALLVILGILGGTLYCGWKCNLFCRPCCKSQYICYGSAIVGVLVILLLVVVTGWLIGIYGKNTLHGREPSELSAPQYLAITLIPITQIYTMAVLWNTIFRLPYTVPEVVALIASAVAAASLLALAVLGIFKKHTSGTITAMEYSFPALHIIALGITWYCLEYKKVFHWPKNHMCFGLLAVTLSVTLVPIVIAYSRDGMQKDVGVKYTMIGYSLLLMIPTLWYAYRCNLFKWCLPKKKGLKGTDTAENTVRETDIAKES
ncbi:uncharacterized protein BBOV_IV012120 [Babesia bovis T2Bo]|uniref:Membrane protein, putative n=1 Tax=Babesia bovis TaxID=5865 RepID=A7ASP5_BABBO|nr:uncharacterized protein BBOV_IV012120 [Babesia bovis T2Bo]EDO07564.1 putative integral membrane protein [Babesia bovis T2Bo]|eukprot:XP_001611132.1 hypothetical protein [Babesia bovis T2Bo]